MYVGPSFDGEDEAMRTRWTSRLFVAGLCVCCLAACGPLQAGLLSGQGLEGWSGSVGLPSGYGFDYGSLAYAVFAPNTFGTLFSGSDTENGGVAAGEYVYAYQLKNLNTMGPVSQFSVGLADLAGGNPPKHGDGIDDLEDVIDGDESYVAGSGVSPSGSFATFNNSVRFDFTPALGNATTAVMFFTSQYGPEWDNSTTNITLGGSVAVPSPDANSVGTTPEPSAFVLAVLAAVVLGAWRRTGA
jgi:hypothetical protein